MTAKQPKNGISLPMSKFRVQLTSVTAHYWYSLCSFLYAERWLRGLHADLRAQRLTQHPGDEGKPFSGQDITPESFIDAHGLHVQTTRNGAIVNIVTAFEVYLFDILERAIFVRPELMSDSDIEIPAGKLAGWIHTDRSRHEFASFVAGKYAFNKTHEKIIERFDNMIKSSGLRKSDGVAKRCKSEIDRWKQFCALRNAIVHASGTTTPYLAEVWPDRFPHVKRRFMLTDGDVVACLSIAVKLAAAIDSDVTRFVLGASDAKLLARELFAAHGLSAAEISFRVSGFLSCKFTKGAADAAVSAQRETEGQVHGFFFTDDVLACVMSSKYLPR